MSFIGICAAMGINMVRHFKSSQTFAVQTGRRPACWRKGRRRPLKNPYRSARRFWTLAPQLLSALAMERGQTFILKSIDRLLVKLAFRPGALVGARLPDG